MNLVGLFVMISVQAEKTSLTVVTLGDWTKESSEKERKSHGLNISFNPLLGRVELSISQGDHSASSSSSSTSVPISSTSPLPSTTSTISTTSTQAEFHKSAPFELTFITHEKLDSSLDSSGDGKQSKEAQINATPSFPWIHLCFTVNMNSLCSSDSPFTTQPPAQAQEPVLSLFLDGEQLLTVDAKELQDRGIDFLQLLSSLALPAVSTTPSEFSQRLPVSILRGLDGTMLKSVAVYEFPLSVEHVTRLSDAGVDFVAEDYEHTQAFCCFDQIMDICHTEFAIKYGSDRRICMGGE